MCLQIYEIYMKLAIYTRSDNSKIEELISVLTDMGVGYILNPEHIDESFDFVVSLGGDGTLLEAVRRMKGSGSYSPLLGINSGRLGFLAKIKMQECREAIEAVRSGEYAVENRLMLKVCNCNSGQHFYALNEFTLQRVGASMVEFDLKIGGVRVAKYWADGIIVSTPTGSTAYSMSVGGAILAPDAKCLIISPVAPHNLSLRPLVVSDSSTIEIVARSRFGEGVLSTIDNTSYRIEDGQRFEISSSSESLRLVTFDSSNFYDTLREKLHWGVDARG